MSCRSGASWHRRFVNGPWTLAPGFVDQELGIVSGRFFASLEGPRGPSYTRYDEKSLLLFGENYLGWGPFSHRSDLVRLTVTVRKRNETQSVVRASVQFYLRGIEDPVPNQKFFRTLEQALFLQSHMVEPTEEQKP